MFTENNTLTPAQFTSTDFGTVRTLEDTRNGEIWFIAKDVCDALSIINNRETVSFLADDEKNTVRLNDGNRGNPNTTIINESGLYGLIIRSRKPEAQAFRKWVTSEVLPAIRKTGAYIQKERVTPSLLREAADEIDRKNFEIAEKNAALKAVQPKVEMADSLTTTQTRYKPTHLAIIFGVPYSCLRDAAESIGMIKRHYLYDQGRYLPTDASIRNGFCIPSVGLNYTFTSTGAALVRRALINAGHKPSAVVL